MPTRRTHHASASLRLRATPPATRGSRIDRSFIRSRVITGTLRGVENFSSGPPPPPAAAVVGRRGPAARAPPRPPPPLPPGPPGGGGRAPPPPAPPRPSRR